MGKSQVSSYMSNMDTQSYVLAMGGSVSHQADRDSGINQPHYTVYRYFDILRNLAVNRFKWTSKIIEPMDLQLIEWLFFMTGKACIIYPTFYGLRDNNKGIRINKPYIFNTNIVIQNLRTSEPLKVNIIDNYINALFMQIKKQYDFRDFAMLSANYTHFTNNAVPMSHTAWEYANKLYELDLAFNANSTKQRIPLLLNNGVSDNRKDTGQQYNSGNFTTGDLVREAMTRNEQFVEIPQSQIGSNGILHQTNQYAENNLLEYITTQRRLYDEFFEHIGVEVIHEKHGVYQAKDVQVMSLANNNYKSIINLSNRRFHAEQANKRFNLDLEVNLLQYM